jgi:hypothetical protein
MNTPAFDLSVNLQVHFIRKAQAARVSVDNFIAAPPHVLYVDGVPRVRLVLANFSQHSAQSYRAFNLAPTHEGFAVFALAIDGGELLAQFRTAEELDSWEF